MGGAALLSRILTGDYREDANRGNSTKHEMLCTSSHRHVGRSFVVEDRLNFRTSDAMGVAVARQSHGTTSIV